MGLESSVVASPFGDSVSSATLIFISASASEFERSKHGKETFRACFTLVGEPFVNVELEGGIVARRDVGLRVSGGTWLSDNERGDK